MKICTKCNTPKDISEYHSDKSKKDGKASACKVCKNKQSRAICQSKEFKARKKEYDKEYRKSESGIKSTFKARTNRVIKYDTDDDYRQSQLLRGAINRSKSGAKEKQRVYQQNIPNEIRAKHNREYRQRNRDKFNKYNREYIRENKYRFAWRQILADTHKRMGTTKESRTIDDLGYSATDLKNHLQSLFTDGMSWDNHGEWHIDHIKPISKFSKESKPSEVNALINLQPLWAYDNLTKGCD